MNIQEYDTWLHLPLDAYAHTLAGEHYEYHEAQRNPGELPLVALERSVKERHNGYEIAKCTICRVVFLRGAGRVESDQCGATHGIAV